MSVKAMAWVWDQELPRDEKLLLLAYADHADDEGNNIFPSVDRMAKKTGYSRRSVQRITRRLIASGMLVEEGSSKYGTNIYSMAIYGGVKMTPPPPKGCQNDTGGVSKSTQGGVIVMTPEPSLTIIKPSEEQKGTPALSPPYTGRDITAVICEATGLVAIPPQEYPRIEQVHALLDHYPYEIVVTTMREMFQKWRSTERKNGTGGYRGTNFGWIDWVQDALLAPVVKDFDSMTVLEQREYLIHKGEELEGSP